MLPNVYATFTVDLTVTQRITAALLYAGEDAMLTGPLAAFLYGLRYGPKHHGVVDLLMPRSAGIRSRQFVHIHRTRHLPLHPVLWLGRWPLAPSARCTIDTIGELKSQRDVRALLCEPVQRRLTTPEALAEQLALARPSTGTALAHRALEDVTAGCRSAPECELRDLVLSSRILPEPRWNKPLPDAPGAQVFPDACWAEVRLVVEIDSQEWHGYGDAPESTERRRALYARLGWRVIPVSPRRLREEPQVVLREIEQAYLQRLS